MHPKSYPESHFVACYPNHPFDTISFEWADRPDSLMNTLNRKYSKHSLLVANSVGLLPILSSYPRERSKFQHDQSTTRWFRIIEQKEKILNRISLFRAQVASVAAELDCEGEGADQWFGICFRIRCSATAENIQLPTTPKKAGKVTCS